LRSKRGRSGSEDHANARLLAEALAHTEGVTIDLETVETNIVVFRLVAGKGAAELAARLKARGVLAGAFGPDAIRLVTHRDVSRKDCIDAAEALTEEIEAGIKTAPSQIVVEEELVRHGAQVDRRQLASRACTRSRSRSGRE
jgi:hypothetical protein